MGLLGTLRASRQARRGEVRELGIWEKVFAPLIGAEPDVPAGYENSLSSPAGSEG